MTTTTTTTAPGAGTWTDALMAELDLETEATRRLLASVPSDDYGWRPHQKGRSMGELCQHIAAALHRLPSMIDDDRFDVSGDPPPDAVPASSEALLESLDEATQGVRTWLASLGDRIHDEWRVVRGDQPLMTMPRWMAIRWLLFNHVYHHRGQLTAYLRASGGYVPSVYGPSADENPFAEA